MNPIKVEVNGDNLKCSDYVCLFCLQLISQNINGEQIKSLDFFFNYIKIRDKAKSIVCNECGGNLATFMKLSNILEKVHLELDYLLESVQNIILRSPKTLNFERQFLSFRNLVAEKCGDKMYNTKAQVILQRLDQDVDLSKTGETGSQTSSYLNHSSSTTINSNNPAIPGIDKIEVIKLEENLEKGAGSNENRKRMTQTKSNRWTSKCEICSKLFYKNQGLQRHINSVHLKLKLFQCPTCPKSFKDISGLHYHIKSTHKQIEAYKCDICDKYFPTLNSLRVHKSRPHKPKPQIPKSQMIHCEICDKYYANLQSYKFHVRSVHTERKFLCGICSKKFKHFSDLRKHISAVHNKQRHYCQVPGCYKNFSHYSSLYSHSKLEHSGVTIPGQPPRKMDNSENLENDNSESNDMFDEYIIP